MGGRGRRADLVAVAAAVVGSAAAAQVVDPPVYTHSHLGRLCAGKDCAGAQADENTYVTTEPQGAYGNGHPAQQDIVGANGRRLILRWTDEGVYVGGCLITDQAVAESLARFITREDEGA